MATKDPKTDPIIEEKEEKDGPSLISNFVQMIILFWSLSVISFAYFGNSTRQIDTTFAAGLLASVMQNMGLQVKNSGNGKKKQLNVVSNKDTNVGIK
tara:strand:+ start:114 stop:404 length:291 start_codon:yes stop_codon:yes gene_type:complete